MFAAKPRLGLAMLEWAHVSGLPFAWSTADSVYGADHALRRWRQELGLGHVLAVIKTQRLRFARVEARVAGIPANNWHRLSAGDEAPSRNSAACSGASSGLIRPKSTPC